MLTILVELHYFIVSVYVDYIELLCSVKFYFLNYSMIQNWYIESYPVLRASNCQLLFSLLTYLIIYCYKLSMVHLKVYVH